MSSAEAGNDDTQGSNFELIFFCLLTFPTFEFLRHQQHHFQLQLMFLNSNTGREDLSASLFLLTFRSMPLSQSYLDYTLYSILIYHYRLDKISTPMFLSITNAFLIQFLFSVDKYVQ